MDDENLIPKSDDAIDEKRTVSRRDFLVGLRKWSIAVIGIAVAGPVFLTGDSASAWVNTRGSWINRGGGGWINRNTTWVNGSGGGGAWVNRAGGGAWVNRRGW